MTDDESWIYAYEPETKHTSTVWVFQDEPNPTKVVRKHSKKMVECFFGVNGHVATVHLVKRHTVNSTWYITICLPEIFGDMRKANRQRYLIFHQNNTSSHTSAQTNDSMSTQKIELMAYPPCSPDLASYG